MFQDFRANDNVVRALMPGVAELVDKNKLQVRTSTKPGAAIVELASVDLSADGDRYRGLFSEHRQ